MFAITENNCEKYILQTACSFLNKEENVYADVAALCKENGLSDKENALVSKALEYVKAEGKTSLLAHKSHIQMLLTMGVRDCPEQAECYNEVMSVAKPFLEELENALTSSYFGAAFGVVDIILYCCTFNLFRYVMIPFWRSQFPKLTAWRDLCSAERCITASFMNTRIAASVREGGQIDVRPDPAFVADLADIAIAKNQDFKKEVSQRQKEKQMKAAAAAAVEEKVETPVVMPAGPVEEPTNDEEKKIFDVLNAMGIAHKTVQHEAANTVEDVVRFVDKSLGLPTKNLFLKAKKPNGEQDSGLWMVCAAYDTTVDMKKLTSDLKYKSGSLRFADNSLLESVLGVHQGHLSLFAKINDAEKKVQVILDKRLLEAENVSLHPLVNTSSTIISASDFKRFAEKYAPGYKVMEF